MDNSATNPLFTAGVGGRSSSSSTTSRHSGRHGSGQGSSSSSGGGGGGSGGSGSGGGAASSMFGIVSAARAAMVVETRAHKRKRHMTLANGTGIPLREALQSVYAVNRDSQVLQAALFTVWMLVAIAVLYMMNNVHVSYSTNNALIDLFIDEEFDGASYKKNFDEIMTMEETWQWLQGPLYNGLYPDEWYNGVPFTETESGYMLNYLRLVGGVQLRQARVSNHSCTVRRLVDSVACHNNSVTGFKEVCGLGMYDTKDETCFSEFSVDRQDTAPFGPPADPTRYKWSDGHSDVFGLFGFGPSTYGSGGFVTELPVNRTQAKAVLDQLEADTWIDRGTRVVVVNFNLYNTNTKLLTVVRIQIEFFRTAHIVKSWKFFSFKLVLYEAATDKIRVVLEAIFVLGWLVYAVKEAVKIWSSRPPRYLHFTTFQNIYEFFLLLVALYLMFGWAVFVLADGSESSFDVEATSYSDLYQLGSNFTTNFSTAGFFTLLCWLKLFKYLGISKRMNALWLTLRAASSDIFAFVIASMVIISGFAYMGHLYFGFNLRAFHSLTISVSTLLRFPLGDFDYDAMREARPLLTGFFFTLYMSIVFFVLFNMFIAIVTKYFDEVHDDLTVGDRWKESAPSFEYRVGQRCSGCYRRFCKIRTRKSKKTAEQQEAVRKADQLAIASLKAEAQFFKLVKKCIAESQRVHHTSLLDYLEKAYKEKGAAHLYLGAHELCILTQPDPCPPGQHQPNGCLAHRLLSSYSTLKIPLMIGYSAMHQPQALAVNTDGMVKFQVHKLLQSGRKGKRIVVVDPKGSLYSMDGGMKLKKKFDLTKLVQIETSNSSNTRVNFVFTNEDTDDAGGDRNSKKDTEMLASHEIFSLECRSNEQRKTLVEHIANAQRAAMPEADEYEVPPPSVVAASLKASLSSESSDSRASDDGPGAGAGAGAAVASTPAASSPKRGGGSGGKKQKRPRQRRKSAVELSRLNAMATTRERRKRTKRRSLAVVVALPDSALDDSGSALDAESGGLAARLSMVREAASPQPRVVGASIEMRSMSPSPSPAASSTVGNGAGAGAGAGAAPSLDATLRQLQSTVNALSARLKQLRTSRPASSTG